MSDANQLMQYDANKKSAGVAYLLWFLFGGLGIHRFYLGKNRTGAALLSITVISLFLMAILIGFITIWISVIWWFIYLFLVGDMVRKYNSNLANSLRVDI